MKKLKRITIILSILLLGLVVCGNLQVFANEDQNTLKQAEYSEDYKRWLQLSEEEKKSVMRPRMYDIVLTKKVSNNLLYKTRLLGANISARYSLKDVIPNNLVIKDQKLTNSCWAFAALSSLETNLALNNYRNNANTAKVYDYSERHMEYYTSRTFANNQENKIGYNRNVGDGGQWYIAESYLTNGSGAINESDMPFENNENIIDISYVQNKKVTSQVSDTIEFADYAKKNNDEKEQIISEVKKHIQNYGSVFASIHGNSSSTTEYTCYNNNTGAKYCNNSETHAIDHAVSIIGWDDNYSIDNFSENSRPSTKGAWIVRNSWGEKTEYTVSELKELIFNTNKQQCISNGWNSASDIPNEIITQMGYTIENGIAYVKIGDKGLIYVSYEDCNISKTLYGIIKASDTIDYENIYQYNNYYPASVLTPSKSTIMLCNVFEKKTSGKEYITQVALNCPETYTCKVYVNPNGSSKAKEDMQLVKLKAGDAETFDAGYHTLEFDKPIEIKASNFVVMVEIQGTRQDSIGVMLETKVPEITNFNCVSVESEKCFIAFGNDLSNCVWLDLGKLTEINATLSNGDSSIKAFTVSKVEDNSLASIEITTPPTKTTYIEGSNFDKTGMVVKANYNNNTSKVLDSSSYSIVNGTNLKINQTSVTITFEDKSVEQPIKVEKNSVTKLTIKKAPNKTTYVEGQNFDKTGMIIQATYKDNTTKIITDYTILNGSNLTEGQTAIKISYEGQTIQQPITVIKNTLTELKITKIPNKTTYVVGQNFEKNGMVVTGIYEDGSTQEIVNYIIENGTNLSLNQTYVTIKYNDKEVNQNITVEAKTVTGIVISKMPTKTQYIQEKEQLDLLGGVIEISYNDGSNEEMSMSNDQVEITGFNNKIIGKNTIIVTYKSKTANFDVEIIKEDIEQEKPPKNSNYENAYINVTSAKYYTFSNKNTQKYIEINVSINEISKNIENDSYEYYYYISSNPNEENIENWVRITDYKSSENNLEFIINTKDVKNYSELSEFNNLYLYIKEVAIKGGSQSVTSTKAMKMNTNISVETYVDNIKVDNKNSGNSVDTPADTKKTTEDTTTAGGILPQTGVKSVLIIIIVISAIGILIYIKYRKISKDLK